MKSKLLIGMVISMCLAGTSQAQDSQSGKKNEFWHRVSVGGTLGFQFGDVTAVNIAPEVMFRAVNQLYVGLGFSYNYMQAHNYYWDTTTHAYLDFKANVYGGHIYARYYLRGLIDNALGNIFGHVEYEYLYYTRPVTQDPYGNIIDPYGFTYRLGNEGQEINSFFVGLGYEQPFSDKAYMDILILYNLNETYNSPYANPIFRLGFGVKL